jgi:hypothetical protein
VNHAGVLVNVSRAPISVTLAGIDSDEGAVLTKFASAVCAEAALLSSEEGTEAVRTEMRDATWDFMSLICDWICGFVRWALRVRGVGVDAHVEVGEVGSGDGDDDEVSGGAGAERGDDEGRFELHCCGIEVCGEIEIVCVEVIAMCDGSGRARLDNTLYFTTNLQASEDLPDTVGMDVHQLSQIYTLWDVRSSLRRLSHDSSRVTSLAVSSSILGLLCSLL